jgi:hypothetical protein
MRAILGILVVSSCSFSVAAQRQTGEVFHSEVKGSRTPIVLRVQRQERYTWSCALVYPGDKVHYETRAMNGTVVHEGALPAESASQLHALIPALEQIDPNSIQHKARLEDVDIVLVGVAAGNGVHNLYFADPSTRKPFKNQVDPLLKWLANLGREHLPQPAGIKSNNCMPQDSFDPGATNAPPAVTKVVAQRMSEHMLLRVQTFGMDEGLSHDRCILVLPEGQYRYEDHTVGDTGREDTKVYAGSLDGDETAELKKILNDPAIANAQHTATAPNGVAASDIDSIELVIPRGDHVQRLDYYSVTGKRAAFENVKVTTDLDDRALHPLNSFLRNSIEKRRGIAPVPNAAPNHCASY